MRKKITIAMVVLGFLLQLDAYFFLAARIGGTSSPAISNPRLQFAPLVFIAGVVLVFMSAVVYELMSGDDDK